MLTLLAEDAPVVSATGARAEELILRLLVQLAIVLGITRIVVALSRRFLGQTDVAGEILAGLVLGPSALGALAPGLLHRVFDSTTAPIFVGLAQVGLVFLMFQIGMEFEFKRDLGSSKRTVLAVSAAGIALPFALGYFAAPFFYERALEPRPPELGFRLFFAIALSITAIPILGRIFLELGLSHTRIASLTIGAAAIDDVAGWILLGVVAAIVRSRFDPTELAIRLAALGVYLGVVFVFVRPLAKSALRAHLRQGRGLENRAIAWLLLLLFLSAVATSAIGVFAIIGGFALGVALHDDRELVREWRERASPLVTTFLLPVFFAYTGLRTDVGSLSGASGWLQCALVCALAFAGKLGGAYAAARLCGESRRDALTIAVCMNTRALMELVALNVGLDLGVLPRPIFTMLVLMAIASTYLATPLIRRLMRSEARGVS